MFISRSSQIEKPPVRWLLVTLGLGLESRKSNQVQGELDSIRPLDMYVYTGVFIKW